MTWTYCMIKALFHVCRPQRVTLTTINPLTCGAMKFEGFFFLLSFVFLSFWPLCPNVWALLCRAEKGWMCPMLTTTVKIAEQNVEKEWKTLKPRCVLGRAIKPRAHSAIFLSGLPELLSARVRQQKSSVIALKHVIHVKSCWIRSNHVESRQIMSNLVIDVKSCDWCQIMSFMSNIPIHVHHAIIHVLWSSNVP
jgi:hypothetical protein